MSDTDPFDENYSGQDEFSEDFQPSEDDVSLAAPELYAMDDVAIDSSSAGEEIPLPQNPQRVGSTRFDQRHLIRLHQLGLIYELPYELGPMPSFPFGPGIDTDLIRWNVLDGSTMQFTPQAAELFAGVNDWQWAVWGIVLLYDERQKVTLEIPPELQDYDIQKAIRDVPRMTFMVTVRDDMVTVLILNNAHMIVRGIPARTNPQAQVGELVREILDPDGKWFPYPLKTEFSVSMDTLATAKAPRLDPDGPDKLEREEMEENASTQFSFKSELADREAKAAKAAGTEAERVKKLLSGSGLSQNTSRGLSDLLRVHNSANAQICISWRTPTGKVQLDGAAMAVCFFDGNDDEHRGVVVSSPRRAPDTSLWVTYSSGTPEAYTAAIRDLYRLITDQVEEEVTA